MHLRFRGPCGQRRRNGGVQEGYTSGLREGRRAGGSEGVRERHTRQTGWQIYSSVRVRVLVRLENSISLYLSIHPPIFLPFLHMFSIAILSTHARTHTHTHASLYLHIFSNITWFIHFYLSSQRMNEWKPAMPQCWRMLTYADVCWRMLTYDMMECAQSWRASAQSSRALRACHHSILEHTSAYVSIAYVTIRRKGRSTSYSSHRAVLRWHVIAVSKLVTTSHEKWASWHKISTRYNIYTMNHNNTLMDICDTRFSLFFF